MTKLLSEKEIRLVKYFGKFKRYYVPIEEQESLEKISQLFFKNRSFDPTTGIEYFYCGSYGEIRQKGFDAEPHLLRAIELGEYIGYQGLYRKYRFTDYPRAQAYLQAGIDQGCIFCLYDSLDDEHFNLTQQCLLVIERLEKGPGIRYLPPIYLNRFSQVYCRAQRPASDVLPYYQRYGYKSGLIEHHMNYPSEGALQYALKEKNMVLLDRCLHSLSQVPTTRTFRHLLFQVSTHTLQKYPLLKQLLQLHAELLIERLLRPPTFFSRYCVKDVTQMILSFLAGSPTFL